ncbi:MAG: AAA family ATPase [Fibrobacteria bacterium]|nr:AAA family ATPase [Fibrobacteria bacterium]
MFIGREKEIALLQRKNWRDQAELIVIYGRRRIGKTALVEEAYKDRICWKFEGLEGRSTRRQIRNFLFTIYQHTGNEAVIQKQNSIKTWQEALLLLDKEIGTGEYIIFFDEFQWMASMRTQLVSTFKWAWDNYLQKHSNCKFVICGSISSFIVKKVLRSRALYGRIDTEINLKPFSLNETSAFFHGKRLAQEVLEIYMAVGGVPQYLKVFEPEKSVAQNLCSLAFEPNGYFSKEYHRLFISHFSSNEQYEKIVKFLALHGPQTRDALVKSLKTGNGGTFSNLLNDLTMAEFIEKVYPIDKHVGGRTLLLRQYDEFLHFYFRLIFPNKTAIETNTIKVYEQLTGPVYNQWRGYAFERLCRKHVKLIAKYLEFSGISFSFGSWFRKNEAQVDLLFKRADNVLTVCEMKYVERIKGVELIRTFEKKLAALQSVYNLPVQKVLILGNQIDVPDKVFGYFDKVILFKDLVFT